MRKYFFASMLSLLFLSCKKTEINDEVTSPVKISSADIDAFIRQQLSAGHKFEWKAASDQMVWSALEESDNILSIGYKPASMKDIESRLHTINIQDAEWINAKNKILDIVLAGEQKIDKDISIDKIIQWEEHV